MRLIHASQGSSGYSLLKSLAADKKLMVTVTGTDLMTGSFL